MDLWALSKVSCHGGIHGFGIGLLDIMPYKNGVGFRPKSNQDKSRYPC